MHLYIITYLFVKKICLGYYILQHSFFMNPHMFIYPNWHRLPMASTKVRCSSSATCGKSGHLPDTEASQRPTETNGSSETIRCAK